MDRDPITPDPLLPPVAGVTHHVARLNGVAMHFALAGEEHGGDPVILLHGFPELWYAWNRVMPLLAADHRVVRPTFAGTVGRRSPRA